MAYAQAVAAELPAPAEQLLISVGKSGKEEDISALREMAKRAYPTEARAIDAILETQKTMRTNLLVIKAQAKQLADARHYAYANSQSLIQAESQARSDRLLARYDANPFANWHGRGQFGAFQARGKSSNIGISLGVKLQRDGDSFRHIIRSNGEYQRTNGQTSRQQFSLSYEPNKQLDDKLYLYGLTQIESDKIQGFDSRISLSAGLGYTIADSANRSLSVKSGFATRRTNFANGDHNDRLAVLSGLDGKWRIAPSLTLTEEASAYLQSGNSTIETTTGIEARVDEKISARMAYIWRMNTDPPPQYPKTDTLSRFTLTYDF